MEGNSNNSLNNNLNNNLNDNLNNNNRNDIRINNIEDINDVFENNTLGRIERSVNDVYNNKISRMIANTSYESPLNFNNISKNTSINTSKNTINKIEEPKTNEEFKPTPMVTRSKVRNRFLSNDNQSGVFNRFDIYNNINNISDNNDIYKNKDLEDVE